MYFIIINDNFEMYTLWKNYDTVYNRFLFVKVFEKKAPNTNTILVFCTNIL